MSPLLYIMPFLLDGVGITRRYGHLIAPPLHRSRWVILHCLSCESTLSVMPTRLCGPLSRCKRQCSSIQLQVSQRINANRTLDVDFAHVAYQANGLLRQSHETRKLQPRGEDLVRGHQAMIFFFFLILSLFTSLFYFFISFLIV